MADPDFDTWDRELSEGGGRAPAPGAASKEPDFAGWDRDLAAAHDAAAALADPKVAGFYRMFGAGARPPDEPAPGIADRVLDVPASAAYGIVKGGADLASLPGLGWDMAGRVLPSWAQRPSWLPASRQDALGALFAPLGVDAGDVERYRPDTALGGYAQSIGEFVPTVLGTGPARALGRYAVIPGVAGETAGQGAWALGWSPDQADFARALGGFLGAGGPGAVKLAGHLADWSTHGLLSGGANVIKGLAMKALGRNAEETFGFTRAEQSQLDHAAKIRAAGGEVPANLQSDVDEAINRVGALGSGTIGTPVPKPPSQNATRLLTSQEALRHGPLTVTVPAPPRDRWDYGR